MTTKVDLLFYLTHSFETDPKHSIKDIIIPCGLMLIGGIAMALQVADPVTIAGFVLVFVGALLLAKTSSATKDETR